MKKEPISVYAINASIVSDLTPTGKAKYIVRLDYDAGTAVDRVQICSDYISTLESSQFENEVFVNGDNFIAHSFKPLNNNAVYLLTCRCEHPSLTKEESLIQVRKGMEKATDKLNEIYSKKS